MNKIFKSEKKNNAKRFTACFLAVLMFFSALSTGSMTVLAETTTHEVSDCESWAEVIDAATVGDTIKLLNSIDLTGESIAPGKAITIDLNGHILKADAFNASRAKVVDNSTDKTGVLKVTNFLPAEDNGQMPVYNGKGGYVFATMTEQVYRKSKMSDDTFELIFKPDFGVVNELLAEGSIATKVVIGFRVEWIDAGGVQQTKNLVFNKEMDDMVKEVYAADSGKAFYIKATGATKFYNLTITPLVKSELGTEWTAKGTDDEFKATNIISDNFEGYSEGEVSGDLTWATISYGKVPASVGIAKETDENRVVQASYTGTDPSANATMKINLTPEMLSSHKKVTIFMRVKVDKPNSLAGKVKYPEGSKTTTSTPLIFKEGTNYPKAYDWTDVKIVFDFTGDSAVQYIHRNNNAGTKKTYPLDREKGFEVSLDMTINESGKTVQIDDVKISFE